MQSTPPKPHLYIKSPSGQSFIGARFSPRTLRNTLGVLCLLVVLGLGAWWGAREISTGNRGDIGTTFELAPGPWGKITAQPILIEAPSDLIARDDLLGDGFWYFHARTADEVFSLLRGSGVSADQTAQLLPLLETALSRDGLLRARPPEALVRSLSPETRSALYDKLALVPENSAQIYPFRTTKRHVDAWLGSGNLPAELVAEVKSLLWERGPAVFFSDYNIVVDKITSPAVRHELLEQLMKRPSVILTLQVPPGGDVAGLAAYYGPYERREELHELLEAVSAAGGGPIGLSDLLPPFARERLYRHPEPLPGQTALSWDCNWTAFNFFSRGEADNTFHDSDELERFLREKYEVVDGEPRFGDVVLLTRPDGRSIHAAVYIADNIVFNKNGMQVLTPFLFTTMDDMLALHAEDNRGRIIYYRRKKI